ESVYSLPGGPDRFREGSGVAVRAGSISAGSITERLEHRCSGGRARREAREFLAEAGTTATAANVCPPIPDFIVPRHPDRRESRKPDQQADSPCYRKALPRQAGAGS